MLRARVFAGLVCVAVVADRLEVGEVVVVVPVDVVDLCGFDGAAVCVLQLAGVLVSAEDAASASGPVLWERGAAAALAHGLDGEVFGGRGGEAVVPVCHVDEVLSTTVVRFGVRFF